MITFKKLREACWSGFKQVGMKKKGKKLVPNCVPEEDQKDESTPMGGKFIVRFKRGDQKPVQAIFNTKAQADAYEKEKRRLGFKIIEDAPANAAGGGGVAGIGVGADGEPGIRPDAAKKYKKKNQDEFKGRILKFLNQFKTMKEEREMTASELASQASNDADLYKRQIQPIIKNLGRKKYKGIFNRDLAIKLFRYAVDNKVKEVKGNQSRMVPGTVRNDAAARLLSSFSSEIDEFAKELSDKKKK